MDGVCVDKKVTLSCDVPSSGAVGSLTFDGAEYTDLSGFAYIQWFSAEDVVVVIAPWAGSSCSGDDVYDWLSLNDAKDDMIIIELPVSGSSRGEGEALRTNYASTDSSTSQSLSQEHDLATTTKALEVGWHQDDAVRGGVIFESEDGSVFGEVCFNVTNCGE